jgi:NAD(P)-dependent dehydrogenase (short-subunit alcohol dehydrogenase family)
VLKAEFTPEAHAATIATNADGAVAVARALAPHLARGARIVNVSSCECGARACSSLTGPPRVPLSCPAPAPRGRGARPRAPHVASRPFSGTPPTHHTSASPLPLHPALGKLGMLTPDYAGPISSATTLEELSAAARRFDAASPLAGRGAIAPSYSVSKAALNRRAGGGGARLGRGGGQGAVWAAGGSQRPAASRSEPAR